MTLFIFKYYAFIYQKLYKHQMFFLPLLRCQADECRLKLGEEIKLFMLVDRPKCTYKSALLCWFPAEPADLM